MKWVNIIVMAAAVVLIIALSALEPRRNQAPAYNAAAEMQSSGVIQEITEFYCPVSEEQGIHFVLKRAEGDMLVHVAPARFLRGQEIRFTAGEQIEVVGARVEYQGRDSILARQITRGNELIVLRNHTGKPLWTTQ